MSVKHKNAWQDGKQRREAIEKAIRQAGNPVSASSLAARFGVSRQIIVGDVSLLRASGVKIHATPRGYLSGEAPAGFPYIRTIVCKHSKGALKEELYTIVDGGGICLDVSIDHEIYGLLVGELNICSRYDADIFADRCGDVALPLSTLSGGVHAHRIACRDEKSFDLIVQNLTEKGILLDS